MRDAVRAVVEAGADADDAHRQVVQHRAVADELVRAQGRERGDGVDERHVAGLGQARRHADHVLLGDADVDEAVGVALGERLDGHEAEVAGQEQHARIGVGELGERARRRPFSCRDPAPRLDRASSASAVAYWSSSIGR